MNEDEELVYKVIGEYHCKNRIVGSDIGLTTVLLDKTRNFKICWILTCNSHGYFKKDNKNKADALFYMSKPWVWCDECAALHFNMEGYINGD